MTIIYEKEYEDSTFFVNYIGCGRIIFFTQYTTGAESQIVTAYTPEKAIEVLQKIMSCGHCEFSSGLVESIVYNHGGPDRSEFEYCEHCAQGAIRKYFGLKDW